MVNAAMALTIARRCLGVLDVHLVGRGRLEGARGFGVGVQLAVQMGCSIRMFSSRNAKQLSAHISNMKRDGNVSGVLDVFKKGRMVTL